MIPDSYVSSGKTPKKIYDAGTIELAGKFKGEERDCLNWIAQYYNSISQQPSMNKLTRGQIDLESVISGTE